METPMVPNGGFVKLLSHMGEDSEICSTARVSTGSSGGDESQDRQLIRYLMRHRHTSPFEFAQYVFHVRAPILVARQWVRHRMASWSEVSGRYAPVDTGYAPPGPWRGQAKHNRQGSEGEVQYETGLFDGLGSGSHANTAEQVAFEEYEQRIKAGVAREQARGCLPLSTWTEWRWSIDLHNLLHFLSLRLAPDAQQEIRAYAHVIAHQVSVWNPMVYEAWCDYRRDAVTLSALDIKVLSAWPLDPQQDRQPGEMTDEHKQLCVRVGMSTGEAREHAEKRRALARETTSK